MSGARCDHMQWVYPQSYIEHYAGHEWVVNPEPYQRSTWGDKIPGDGKFECTQCGEVGYYTGAWRKFWEAPNV